MKIFIERRNEIRYDITLNTISVIPIKIGESVPIVGKSANRLKPLAVRNANSAPDEAKIIIEAKNHFVCFLKVSKTMLAIQSKTKHRHFL